jgi:hypothetical protein
MAGGAPQEAAAGETSGRMLGPAIGDVGDEKRSKASGIGLKLLINTKARYQCGWLLCLPHKMFSFCSNKPNNKSQDCAEPFALNSSAHSKIQK